MADCTCVKLALQTVYAIDIPYHSKDAIDKADELSKKCNIDIKQNLIDLIDFSKDDIDIRLSSDDAKTGLGIDIHDEKSEEANLIKQIKSRKIQDAKHDLQMSVLIQAIDKC